jgi:hypothetical protein
MLMAGGDTEVGGNGSVYWRARHYGEKQSKRKLKCKPQGQQHKNDEIDVDSNEALGRDGDTNVNDVGNRFQHPGFFGVTLRFATEADAQAACTEAARNVQSAPGGFYVRILVPAKNRSNPNVDPPFEVKVEW